MIRQKGALIGGITALALLLFVVLGATTIHAQSSSSDSSQSCSALGTHKKTETARVQHNTEIRAELILS